MTRDRKLLLEEQGRECRLIDTAGAGRSWQFFDWKKTTMIIPDRGSQHGFSMKGSARYIHGTSQEEFPVMISDRKLAVWVLTDQPVICCDIPAYGSYFRTNGSAIDYLISAKEK